MSHPLLCIWQNRRRLDLESDFFAQGNFERYKMFLQRFRVRTPAGDADENDSLICLPTNQIICAEVGCSQVFSSLRMVHFLFSAFTLTSRNLTVSLLFVSCHTQFEEHKFRCHGHQCSLCNKSFSSDRLLSLHISELHDSYFAVASKKKAMYCCLVETCNQVFWNDEARRVHLVQNHMFHPSYDFHNPKKFLKKFKSKLHTATNSKILSSSSGTPSVAQGNSTCEMETPQPATIISLNRAQRRAAKFHTNLPTANTSIVTSSNKMNITMEVTEASPALNTIHVNTDQGSDSMEIDDALEEITSALRTTNIQVPSKISFGRRRGHH